MQPKKIFDSFIYQLRVWCFTFFAFVSQSAIFKSDEFTFQPNMLFFMHDLHSLFKIWDKLSTRSDHLLYINLQLSINVCDCFLFFFFTVIIFFYQHHLLLFAIIFLTISNFFFFFTINFFLIGTEKVIYFSVFSPKHSNWPLNSCLIIK